MARHGQGRSLIRLGKVAEGMSLLDEGMVGVTAGEVSPITAGALYCSMIEACHELFDVRRAQEWTGALTRWCEQQKDLVPYRGTCLVHRVEMMQLQGAWPDAVAAAQQACDQTIGGGDRWARGAAFYRQGELHRLRGDFDGAEHSYRQASQWGRDPQPGLAQLRLAQGQLDSAVGAIRRALEGAAAPSNRAALLPAFVEIALAAGDAASAHAAADELAEIAASFEVPFLRAQAAQAMGAFLLAEGDARAGLGELSRALMLWQEVGSPYDAARCRVLLGIACRAAGDEDTAGMEFEAARNAFRQLGAGPDLVRLDALSRRASPALGGGLTGRELEVLRLVATGRTNRAIADDLYISEKTVARHLSNIFTKLGLSTRAEATAHAYRQHLV
jgi:DNA-binding CsgD family transcriptional regulator